MTEQQRSLLKAAGWTTVTPGLWRSPFTQRDYPEREALAIASVKPRGHRPTLYSRR